MEQIYFFSHKKTFHQDFVPVISKTVQRMRKVTLLLIVLVYMSANALFSQNDPQASFNYEFWNGYADKLQLGAKEREEFMSAHKLQSGTLSLIPQGTQQHHTAGGRIIDPNNSLFAGPCVNADFELGNLNGWTRSCGYNPGFNPLGCCPNPNGQQAVMSGVGLDPFGPFPVVCPGGNYSLRLGNSLTGGEADRIEQTFLVSPSNANFSYKYAVVFQDPGHPVNQQPYFQVDLEDSLGVPIPCTSYYVAAGAGIPGFFNSVTAGVIYKPWTTVLIDLTPYLGQSITIRFSTYDCSLGGHFGYAYVDGVCQSFSSGGSYTVCAGTSTTFCAPSGVDSYTWNGPGLTNFVGQCASTSAAGIYTVTTTLFTGCPGPNFTYTLSNQPAPVPLAGPGATVCANNDPVSLSGSITGYSSTPIWSSGGSGAFTSTTNLTTTYTPSSADISAGSVTITLTTAGNGFCPPATDKLVISITPAPIVNAGTGGSSCNSNSIALNGSVTAGSTTGKWTTSGNGTFSPTDSLLTASYIPGTTDISVGSVTLTLTSTNNGNCFPGSDTVIYLIKKPAIANAGANQFLCSTTSTIGLSGIIGGGSSTGVWSSSGTGGFSPSTTSLNTAYSITAGDITTGTVTFTLTSSNNGPCPAASDTVEMRIILPSTVTAGPNQFLCSTAGSINLSGLVSGYSSTGIWASSGIGAFNPGTTSLSTSYSLTAADLSTGLVTFTLSSTNNGPCAAVNDTVKMRIRIPAVVSSGTNHAFCSNTTSLNLSGTVSGGSTTGIWSASGAGAFSPSTSSLNTNYGITAADIALGSVVFTLTSSNNGPCAAVQDTVLMPIIKIATITAGPNQLVCSSGSVINLAGTINSPSNTVSWISNGSGSYNPSNAVINPTYNLTSTDISAGLVAFTVTSTNNGPCPAVKDSVLISIKKLAIINAGTNQNICSNSPTLHLNGTIGGGATTVSWTSSGAGSFAPNATSLITNYVATAADINTGNVIFTLTSNNNGPCPAVTDSVMMVITKIATVTAGPNLYICSNASTLNLAGSVTSPSNTVNWSSNGSGLFIPNASATSNTYSFSANDVTTGTVIFTITSTNNGVCPAVTDTVKMRLMKLASVNAGTNQALCSNISTLSLNGIIIGAGGTGAWSSNGIGVFVPTNTALITSYSITSADITNGQVSFTLSSTNNGPCPVVTDSVKISISTLATVNAGVNQYLCSSQNSIALMGTVSGVTSSGQWTSSGAGSFSPGNNILAGSYSLTANDVSNGLVTFTLSSTNNGVCPVVRDTVKMKILKIASVNAGANQALCSNMGTLALNGTVTGASGTGAWSTNGAGSFVSSSSSLTTSYSITPADINNGLVIYTLSSTGNGPCPIVSDTVEISLRKIAVVNAGVNQFICSSQNSITLSATVSGGTSTGQWAASGAGSFSPGNTSLNTSYSLTPIDVQNGVVIFTLVSTGNGVCPTIRDTVRMKIRQIPVVNAGSNQLLCSSQGSIALSGAVNGGGNAGTWITSGNGSFNPGASSFTTSYAITAQDISTGTIIFTLSSQNSGPCPERTDTVGIKIITPATVTAGPSQTICSANGSIGLSGSVAGGLGSVLWSSSGTGSFNPGNTIINSSYVLTPADVANGIVNFTLTSTNNSNCVAGSSYATIIIKEVANVNAGVDKFICSTQSLIPISGVISGVTTSGSWSGNGSGVFNPNAVLTSYSVAPADITAGHLKFVLTSTNNDICPAVSDTMLVSISLKPTITLRTDTTLCSTQTTLALTATVSGGTGTPIWATSGMGSFLPNNSMAATFYSISPQDFVSGNLYIVLEFPANSGPCGFTGSTLNVHVSPGPHVDFSAAQYTVHLPGGSVQLTNQSSGAIGYSWSFGDGDTSVQVSPLHNYTTVGFFTAQLVAENRIGCKDSISKIITVINDVQFPTAFTPNPHGSNGGAYDVRDYSNDVFFPYVLGVVEYDLMIFNRWGELIFRSNDIKVGWDGYFNGKLCQQDAYVWKTNLVFFDGRKYNKTGSITLLR